MIKKFFIFLILSFLGIPMILVSLGLFIPVYYTPLMIIRSVQNSINPATVTTQKNISSNKIHHSWVSQDQISKHMKLAVIAAEDSKFFEHNGFDWEAIEKAIKYNETHKNKKGASTISQQTAKNLFLWPGRSWIRKGLETYFTFLIESIWSKQRILEVYLNITEFSPTVFGVQAASQVFFHKTALQINGSEAALLAAVLPNPKKFKVAGPSAYVQNRQSRILTRMQQQAFLDKMINTSKNNISKDDTNHSKNKSELINKPVSENVPPPTHNPANLLNEKNNSKIDTAPNIKTFVKDPESNNTDSDEDSLTPITDDEELENIEN